MYTGVYTYLDMLRFIYLRTYLNELTLTPLEVLFVYLNCRQQDNGIGFSSQNAGVMALEKYLYYIFEIARDFRDNIVIKKRCPITHSGWHTGIQTGCYFCM